MPLFRDAWRTACVCALARARARACSVAQFYARGPAREHDVDRCCHLAPARNRPDDLSIDPIQPSGPQKPNSRRIRDFNRLSVPPHAHLKSSHQDFASLFAETIEGWMGLNLKIQLNREYYIVMLDVLYIQKIDKNYLLECYWNHENKRVIFWIEVYVT